MAKKPKIDTSGGGELSENPFGGLDLGGLPDAPKTSIEPNAEKLSAKPKRGRVNVRREKAGRGGKTVTVVYDFESTVHTAEREQLLKAMKARLGCGGAFKNGQLELQGDRVDAVVQWLCEQGFRAVKAGG